MRNEIWLSSPYTAFVVAKNGDNFLSTDAEKRRFLTEFLKRCDTTQKDVQINSEGWLTGKSDVMTIQTVTKYSTQKRGLLVTKLLNQNMLFEAIEAESSILFTPMDTDLASQANLFSDQLRNLLKIFVSRDKMNGVVFLPRKRFQSGLGGAVVWQN